jgi:hypothetical protein
MEGMTKSIERWEGQVPEEAQGTEKDREGQVPEGAQCTRYCTRYWERKPRLEEGLRETRGQGKQRS